MVKSHGIERWRSWVPVPVGDRGFEFRRWVLLEADRWAVVAALLSLTFLAVMASGTVWPFQLRRLLTETQAVQSVLDTFLSGIILLVSIVVSINAIVLSYDITPVGAQEDRIEGALQFRRELDEYAGVEDDPTDPTSFLQVMAEAIRERAEDLEAVAEGADEEFAQDVQEYVESVSGTADALERALEHASGAEFGVLWLGLETEYEPLLDRSRRLTSRYDQDLPEETDEVIQEFTEALELFATGREYFKTLYYGREVAQLSRALLVISLPAIVVTAVTILAINAGLFPDVGLFGVPPLLTFVAVTVTVSLAPYIVLTAYMLRIATVALETSGAGPFALES